MTFTSATASGRGRATRRMIAICSASATTVVEARELRADEPVAARAADDEDVHEAGDEPLGVVDSPHAGPVNPPSHARCRPAVSPVAVPSSGPPMIPASIGPMARVFAMAPWTGKPRYVPVIASAVKRK